MNSQPYILAKPQECGLSLAIAHASGAASSAAKALKRVASGYDIGWGTLGIGEPVVRALEKKVPGLGVFPAMAAPGTGVPSTQQAMWIMLQGTTQGEVFARLQRVKGLLQPEFVVADSMPTFHNASHDLTGYEDGTENPKGKKATKAAILGEGAGAGLAASSFVAVQRWVHDLAYFNSLSPSKRDAVIGRRLADNAEIETAPESAHVKRTAQEQFGPNGFMLRRSMSFATDGIKGLEFISYVAHLDTFERQMRHMAGLDADGIADALFLFSRPVTGGYYWCPPVRGGRADLRILGL
jgi:porphyrinogen peroxidase